MIEKITKRNINAFTYTELVITIVILGVLAATALPRYLVSLEKTRAAEGVQILSAVREAQQIYFFENGAYSEDLAELEIDFTSITPKYFTALSAENGSSNNVIAVLTRNGTQRIAQYDLCVQSDGNMLCDQIDPICSKIGITPGACP